MKLLSIWFIDNNIPFIMEYNNVPDESPLNGRIADRHSTFLKSFEKVKNKRVHKFYGSIQLNEHFVDPYGQESMYLFGDDFVIQAGILCDSSDYENRRYMLACKLANTITNDNSVPAYYQDMSNIITPEFDFEVVRDRVIKLNRLCYMMYDIILRGMDDNKPKLPSNNLYIDYTIYLPDESLSKFQKDLYSYLKIAEALLQFEFDYVTHFWDKENFAIFFDWTLNLLRDSDDDWKDKIVGEPIAKELILTAKFPMFFIKLSSEELTFIVNNLKNNPPNQEHESNFTVPQLEIWFNNLTGRKKTKIKK